MPNILSRSALLTASVLMIIGMSASFAWVLTIEGVRNIEERGVTLELVCTEGDRQE